MTDEDHIRQEQARLAALRPGDLQPAKLPNGIGGTALVFAIRHIFTLLRIGLPFLVALALLYFLIIPWLTNDVYVYDPFTAMLMGQNPYVVLAIELIEMAIFATAGAVYAVAVHRWIILDKKPGSGLYFRFTRAELKFGMLTALLFLSWDFPTVIGPILMQTDLGQHLMPVLEFMRSVAVSTWPWILVPLIIVIAVVVPGLSLIFPHVAVTGKLRPGISWVAMRGHYGSWIVTFLVVNIALGILLNGIILLSVTLDADQLNEWLFLQEGSNATGIPDIAATAFYGTLIMFWAGIAEAANIAALSFIYQGAVKIGEGDSAEEPEAP